ILGDPYNAQEFQVRLKVELYLPPGYGATSIDLTNYGVGLDVGYEGNSIGTGTIQLIAEEPESIPSIYKRFGQFGIVNGSKTMLPGSITVVASNAKFRLGETKGRSDLKITGLRLSLFNSEGGSVTDRIELIPTLSERIPYTIGEDHKPEDEISSRSVDDPSINKATGDWGAQASNTFGSLPSSTTLGAAPLSLSAQQDTDSSDLLTDAGMHFPSPKGQAENPLGRVDSIADLGFVHTGVHTTSSSGSGVPWRTVRLQPQASTTNLPDWLLLDLFQLPLSPSAPFADAPLPFIAGTYASTGGKIGLNNQVFPFEATMDRTAPLEAVFENASKGAGTVSALEATAIVRNIRDKTLATSGKLYDLPDYVSPGQIVEVKDIADGGEISEKLVRQAVDLLSVRSGVFSIYSVGQSIRQTPSGNIEVLGEQRSQALVERIQETGGTPAIFRTITLQPLNQSTLALRAYLKIQRCPKIRS
ncbi:MAG: hypothetical protein ACK5MR_09935, partial [Cumulibacter sp.]